MQGERDEEKVFVSSRRRHTRSKRDWSSDVCSSDLERSSARETTARVAAGAVAKTLLKELGIEVASYVKEINGIIAKERPELSITERQSISEESPVRVLDKQVEQQMMDRIDEAKKEGDSIGGICEVYVTGMPPGMGSYVHYDR